MQRAAGRGWAQLVNNFHPSHATGRGEQSQGWPGEDAAEEKAQGLAVPVPA